LDEKIIDVYASSFTIIVYTQDNNYYYLGKNPTYNGTNTFYSKIWKLLEVEHTIFSITT